MSGGCLLVGEFPVVWPYGTEWDVMATKPVTPNLSLALKYADYQADTFATDTQKIWLMGEFKF